ncbi:hypothetical protein [secondary endosymbiont of Heteropsylla cubana]|uniref:hypothetical protein n=1 Tax=secondary endosymbiont of Heteropsylla cubana TaxID=134287 RepID=UPI0002F6B60B|nr:hypothetical protein [secondary endosymbiont of Heteropsylla cubana]
MGSKYYCESIGNSNRITFYDNKKNPSLLSAIHERIWNINLHQQHFPRFAR